MGTTRAHLPLWAAALAVAAVVLLGAVLVAGWIQGSMVSATRVPVIVIGEAGESVPGAELSVREEEPSLGDGKAVGTRGVDAPTAGEPSSGAEVEQYGGVSVPSGTTHSGSAYSSSPPYDCTTDRSEDGATVEGSWGNAPGDRPCERETVSQPLRLHGARAGGDEGSGETGEDRGRNR
jgi:hypothetical protein